VSKKTKAPKSTEPVKISPLALSAVIAQDKKGKDLKSLDGEPLYKQHDSIALIQLLNSIDAKQFGFKGYKTYLRIQDKVENAWRDDLMEIELSLDEATFLKDYLTHFEQKSRKDSQDLTPFLIRTLVHIVEQLGENS